MSIGTITALVETLVGVGATPEQILAAVRTAEAQKDTALETSREKARVRVQNWRERNKPETVRNATERSVADTSRLTGAEACGLDNLLPEEISGKEESKKGASPAARSSRGTRIPDGFQPDIEAAVGEGASRPDAILWAKSFNDFWRAKPGKDAFKLDWQATWRVWYRRNIADKPRARAGPSGKPINAVDANISLDLRPQSPPA